ncbi:Ribonuclease III domain containing protein [Parasponia andersonii]|uniref:Ribonuclease III domain containing protein n=1 Tax=Parasponia andersonii TaxID=3476 RepID=A0A2P5CJ72_PARAD|nr:Ribonuclease III domain containing protein [Parasponia andersonii]
MLLPRFTIFITIVVLAILPQFRGDPESQLRHQSSEPSSSFSKALEILQKQIGYNFQSTGLLRRAMTHSSFSEENNRALSLLGASLIETSASLHYIQNDIDISAKDLTARVTDISKVETSCARDGTRLGLPKVVRVSDRSRTNSSTPSVVCGAFRAIFGAIAIDTGKSDDAGTVFWAVHGGKAGEALAS